MNMKDKVDKIAQKWQEFFQNFGGQFFLFGILTKCGEKGLITNFCWGSKFFQPLDLALWGNKIWGYRASWCCQHTVGSLGKARNTDALKTIPSHPWTYFYNMSRIFGMWNYTTTVERRILKNQAVGGRNWVLGSLGYLMWNFPLVVAARFTKYESRDQEKVRMMIWGQSNRGVGCCFWLWVHFCVHVNDRLVSYGRYA